MCAALDWNMSEVEVDTEHYQNWHIQGRTVVFPAGYDPENVPGVFDEYPFAGIGSERARELLELNFKRGRKWTVPLEEVARKLGKRRQTVGEWIKDLGGLPKVKADRLCRAFLLDDAVHLLTGVSGKERAEKADDEVQTEMWLEDMQRQEDERDLHSLAALAVAYEGLPPRYRAALEDCAKGYALVASGGDPEKLREMGNRGARRACELVTEGWGCPGGVCEWFASYAKTSSVLNIP